MSVLSSRRSRPSARELVTRIIEEPALAQAVQALEPRTLARLIDHVGLEDAGELVALATTAQLAAVFDEDLWRSPRPGQDETLDGGRFAVWLEIMLEIGERYAARKLVGLSEDLLAHALSTRVLVVDMDELTLEMSGRDRDDDDEVELLEKALDGTLHLEIDRFRVIARDPDGWDALAAVLLAVDEEDHGFLVRLLERLAFVAARAAEDSGGLTALLTEDETLAADAAAEREERRSRAGYVPPSQAAAFLKLARVAPTRNAERDPVTRAYFRELARAPKAAALAETAPVASPLIEVLRDAEVLPTPRAQLGGRVDEPTRPAGSLRRLLADLAERDPDGYARRTEELAYLANVLVAGLDLGGRPPRPLEAAEIVLLVCERGLDELGADAPADLLFRAGWAKIPDERELLARVVGPR
jgi:hypothetical protein